MPSFKCCDMGWDCQFEIAGEPRNDIARKVICHLHEEHGMDVIPTEIIMKAYDAIQSNGSPQFEILGMSKQYNDATVP